jgi:hypothetical protein
MRQHSINSYILAGACEHHIDHIFKNLHLEIVELCAPVEEYVRVGRLHRRIDSGSLLHHLRLVDKYWGV